MFAAPFEVLVGGCFTSSKPFVLIVAFMAGSLFLLNLSAWFPYRGGFFSIVSGVLATDARAHSVDIDPSGLDLPVEYTVLIISILHIIDADFRRKWISYFTITLPLTSAFVFSNTFENAAITDYMVYHGYSRCPARDQPVKKGRVVVWFDDYALSPTDCPIGHSHTHQPTKGS